jgi:hypothetical protein
VSRAAGLFRAFRDCEEAVASAPIPFPKARDDEARSFAEGAISPYGRFIPNLSMVMAAETVDMSMIQFFGGRIPDIGHLDIEIQSDSGHGVIPIQKHVVAVDVEHGYQL